jgi:hypothetical protein
MISGPPEIEIQLFPGRGPSEGRRAPLLVLFDPIVLISGH